MPGIYCFGCNAGFLSQEGDGACPRCGRPARLVQNPTLLTRSALRDNHLLRAQLDGGESRPNPVGLIGSVIDRYCCEELLGQGGMGWVFLAKHLELGRNCALKILCPWLVDRDTAYLQRFRVEARAAAGMVHPHVVTTHAVGCHDGYHFLEMEFVGGRSLQRTIEEGRLSPLRATQIVAGIAAALAEAHRQGIIHRDVKPDNVLLTHRGVPKLGDFGLAKDVQTHSPDGENQLAGTPYFLAPEVLAGEPPSPAADVYALGVCYYQMLTGRFPFTGDTLVELKTAVLEEQARDVRELHADIPLEMAECLNLFLEKSPSNRPHNGVAAQQLAEAVLGGLEGLETILHQALDDEAGVSWFAADRSDLPLEGQLPLQRFQVDVSLPTGRRQQVLIETTDDGGVDRLLSLTSLCAPADPSSYERVLRLNSTLRHGAISLREVEGRPYFVMTDCYPRSTIDAEEIRRSVREMATCADEIERRLTNQDLH